MSKLRPDREHDTETRLAREVAELEARVAETRGLGTIYRDHLLRLLEYRIGRRREAIERLRRGERPPVLAQLALERYR
jgi:hypothetical protein